MIDHDIIAARVAATFDCDVHVLLATSASRPTGGVVTTYGPVDRTIDGRIRAFRVDTDNDQMAGQEANTATWLVTVERYSRIKLGDRLVVIPKSRKWSRRLRVVGVRDAKSAYVADRLACLDESARA